MPHLTDKNQIRAILRIDPVWSVFALGDLAPGMFEKTRWFVPDLTLVLHDFGTSIVFAIGTGSIREALQHVTWPVRLQVQPDALDEVARHATVTTTHRMWRMGWSRAPVPFTSPACLRLHAGDVAALQRLYADGDATGESPDFFFPSMVTEGVFFGIYEDGELAAAAGTHLVYRDEGIAAVGNIYTRRDRRSRGLGRLVTSAVLEALTDVDTVGLSVRADNDAAIHLYESLGFTRHCPFYEALAHK